MAPADATDSRFGLSGPRAAASLVSYPFLDLRSKYKSTVRCSPTLACYIDLVLFEVEIVLFSLGAELPVQSVSRDVVCLEIRTLTV